MSTAATNHSVATSKPAAKPAAGGDDTVRDESNVTAMVDELSVALEAAIGEIHAVNSETKVLSLNARIEAARAGTHGAAFGVVAEEMQTLSEKTEQIASVMANRTREKTSDLMHLIDQTVRGTRLSDLALVNIDLVDRNLYERTCDVRWWATDGSLVDALTDPTPENTAFASKRLGVILSAYTVYFDLVLCDAAGKIVANGRPSQYDNVGKSQASEPWFTQAMASRSGDEYSFQSAHLSSLVLGQPALVYGAAVREGGESNGRPLGALGIVFNWPGLADPIMQHIPVSPSEQSSTRAYIITPQGEVVASRGGESVGTRLNLPDLHRIAGSDKGFYVASFEDQPWSIGHARAPGFETYSTGWHSIVMQPVSN